MLQDWHSTQIVQKKKKQIQVYKIQIYYFHINHYL